MVSVSGGVSCWICALSLATLTVVVSDCASGWFAAWTSTVSLLCAGFRVMFSVVEAPVAACCCGAGGWAATAAGGGAVTARSRLVAGLGAGAFAGRGTDVEDVLTVGVWESCFFSSI